VDKTHTKKKATHVVATL